MARFVKVLEIAIMLVAGVGWLSHTLWLLVAAVIGMGFHSTIFGPVKYAYLPQHLHPEELIGGNAVIEAGTFVGIVLGEVLGAVLVEQAGWGIELVAGDTLLFAVIR
jgi:MFS family permease